MRHLFKLLISSLEPFLCLLADQRRDVPQLFTPKCGDVKSINIPPCPQYGKNYSVSVGNKQMRQGTGGGPSVRSFNVYPQGGESEQPLRNLSPAACPKSNTVVGCNINACRFLKFSLILYIGRRRRADGRAVDVLAPVRYSNQDLWCKRTDQL